MKKWVYRQIRDVNEEKPPAPLWQRVLILLVFAVILGRLGFYLLYGV